MSAFEKTLSGVLIGAIGGGCFGLLKSFLSQPGYAEKLVPKPECFTDERAAKLFFDLAKYRFNDEEAYVEALHNFDSLFCLEEQLRTSEIKPSITDPPTAVQYGVRAFTHLRNLRSKIQEDNIYEEAGGIIKQLESIAENHCGNIATLCRVANV